MSAPRALPKSFLLVILVGAVAPLCFRGFITLDGPMHVLHACIAKAELFSGRYATADVAYAMNRGTLDLSDLLLLPVTWLFSPPMAHRVFASLVLLVLGAGTWWSARSLGVRDPRMLVWVLPFSFSYVFILGFFTFLLAAGSALMVLGWWAGRQKVRWDTLALAVVLVVGCQAIHRSGATLALLFLFCFETTLRLGDGEGWRKRWDPIALRWRWLGGGVAALTAGWKVAALVGAAPFVRLPYEQDRWQELFQGRPLLLFAKEREWPFLVAIGVLLTVSLAIALWARVRDRRITRVDAAGLAALVLLLSSALLHTPNAQFLYLSTRAQTIALLPLAVWLSGSIPSKWYSSTLAAGILVMFVWRTHHLEEALAGTQAPIDHAMEVVGRLPQHGVTLPVVLDDNWLMEHISAFPAAAYEGVFLSPCDHAHFVHRPGESWQLRDYYDGYQHELRWLDDHVASGTAPVIDHIVVFGRGRYLDERWISLSKVKDSRFFTQWTNDYAEVWAVKQATTSTARNRACCPKWSAALARPRTAQP